MFIFSGPLIFGSHISVFWLWFNLALTNTLNSHSGYHLPFFPSNEAKIFTLRTLKLFYLELLETYKIIYIQRNRVFSTTSSYKNSRELRVEYVCYLQSHDFHHLKFTQCYGVLGILDYLHGTDSMFRLVISYTHSNANFFILTVDDIIEVPGTCTIHNDPR